MTSTTLPSSRSARPVRWRRLTPWAIALLLVALGALAYQRFGTRDEISGGPAITMPVTRGPLTVAVTASGNLQPAWQVDLAFPIGGIVREILVREGDRVTSGQPLARLQADDLELAVAADEAALRSARLKLDHLKAGATDNEVAAAQARLDSARAALNALYAGPTPAELTDAEARIRAAQAQLAKVRSGASGADVADARARLASAQASRDKVVGGPSETDIANARQRVEGAKNSLWGLQSNRDAVCGRAKNPDEDTTCNQARAAVNQAEAQVQIAENDLEKLLGGPNPHDVAVADGGVRQAEAALARVQSLNPNDITVAEQGLRQAEAALARLKQGPTEVQVAQAEAAVKQAELGLAALQTPDSRQIDLAQTAVDQAAARLRQSQLKLQQATLTAPTDGIVTAVSAVVGQTVGAGSNPVQLANLSALKVVTNVSELDRGRLQVGQPVDVTFDAVPGLRVRGEIARISPTGVSQQGVVVFPVTVTLSNAPPRVAAGMTTTLNIVIERKDGVLRVPSRALRGIGERQFVTVDRGGQQVDVPVTVGMTDGLNSEVTGEGLKEGDLVVVSGGPDAPPGAGGNVIMGPAPGLPPGAAPASKVIISR